MRHIAILIALASGTFPLAGAAQDAPKNFVEEAHRTLAPAPEPKVRKRVSPAIFAGAVAAVGTPGEVRAILDAQLAESGTNYLGCRFAFGDLTLAESLRSLDLFAREVMPHLSANEKHAAC